MSAVPMDYNGVECLQCGGEYGTMREYLNHRGDCEGRQ